MKYSISNIAWDKCDDAKMYQFLKENKIDAIEIAPTRLFENPYDNIESAYLYADMIKNKYNLQISSMQSIWYQKTENIFNKAHQEYLLHYTKKAIDFAGALEIKNVVFGCPKNRNMPDGAKEDDVLGFFREIGEYALKKKTVLSIEPNPVIYGTNFINTTKQAVEFCKKVDCDAVKVNIDFGAIIYNDENPHVIKTYKNYVNHIHLSMPNLEYVEKVPQHSTLKKVLNKIDYDKYLSIEMKNCGDVQKVIKSVLYMKENF